MKIDPFREMKFGVERNTALTSHHLIVVIPSLPFPRKVVRNGGTNPPKSLAIAQRLTLSMWRCNPRPSTERWAKMARQISRGVRPYGHLPIVRSPTIWSPPIVCAYPYGYGADKLGSIWQFKRKDLRTALFGHHWLLESVRFGLALCSLSRTSRSRFSSMFCLRDPLLPFWQKS